MAPSKCYIESLPVELLSPILTYLPDLESLDNVLRASPAAFRVFDNADFSAKIFEAVLSSGATHKYSCALIRIITLIRADLLPLFPSKVYDFNTFKNLIVHETTPYTYTPPLWEHPPVCLPSNLDPTILRWILVTNRKILRLTFGCLDFYLARFRVLKPYHSAGFRCDGKPWIDQEGQEDFLGPWRQKPDNFEFHYPVYDIGPPTWVEQQRVSRIFWRIQLSHDIKAIIRASRITWPKNDENNWKLDRLEPEALIKVPWNSVQERMNRHDGVWQGTARRGVIGVDHSLYSRVAREAPGSVEDRLCLDRSDYSKMWSLFYGLSGPSDFHHGYHFSPVQHVEFKHFRRLGFAIWSSERMIAFGLLIPIAYDYCLGMLRPYMEAWRNLLAEEERTALDMENKRTNKELGFE